MRMSETISKISIDLVKATSEIKNAVKTTSGYGYKYAPLDEVLNIVRPICAKYNISIIQSQNFDKENGYIEIETLLLHSSGEYISTSTISPFENLKGMNTYQSMGSAITYLRRYGLSSALALASEEDNDTNTEKEVSKKTNPQNQSKPQQQVQIQTNQPNLKALGIEIVNQNGLLVAKDIQNQATYKNKEMLKQMGFKFDGKMKSWVKQA